MGIPLNILIVEDSVDDAAIFVDELQTAGFEPRWKRVETEPDFLAELQKLPDIILSDFSMPQFNGLRAAQLTQESGLEIPLILISGTVGEDIAVEAMQLGATDYLLKDRIGRLGSAIQRALEQKRLRVERNRAEQSLHDSEEKFRQIAEYIAQVFWITDALKHQMIYVSPAYETIWGRTCESLYQFPQTWMEAIHPEDRNRILEAAKTKQARGDYDEYYRIKRPDGSLRWIRDRAFPVLNAAGEVYRIVGTAEDITERRQLEEQFRQAQKMEAFGQLAGGVAHDINNILAVIQMQSGLLKDAGSLNPEQTAFADEITVSVQRGAALTRQLLLFSRREVFQPRDLDLSISVAQTTKMLQRILGEQIHVEVKLAPQPMFVRADAGMMDQVLLNLAVNARDAMPDGGRLIIETAGTEVDEFAASQSPRMRAGSFVCLSVSDSGSGIPPEILPKIFEPFFTTKGVGKGTGLGLATTLGIVQQHLGWINVYSEVGQGTSFRIYLPRLGGGAHPQPSRPEGKEPRRGSETILLAEDDPVIRASVQKALSKLGYRILEASSGVKALEVWKQHGDEIRLLLTDLVMPGELTGKQLAEDLLQQKSGLKVIYMSGYSADILGTDFAIKEGVNFLTKPFSAAKLNQVIRHCLDNHV